MLQSAQITYLEEVLGVSPRHYVVPPASGVVILTPALTAEEMELLQKILLSAGLSEAQIFETLPAQPVPAHVLAFLGQSEGREARGRSVWWNLPTINSMCGTTPEVAAFKKTVWNLVQQYKKENP